MLILGRLSSGAGVSVSFVAGLSFAAPEELGPRTGGVSVLGEAAGVLEPEGPPSLAILRLRICSIVSWSGATGVGAGGGCSVGSIFAVVDGVLVGRVGNRKKDLGRRIKLTKTGNRRNSYRKTENRDGCCLVSNLTTERFGVMAGLKVSSRLEGAIDWSLVSPV
jgi:hypothetical protein